MLEEAQARQKQSETLQHDINKEKEQQKAQKLRLKEIQDHDIKAKNDFYRQTVAAFNTDDFKDKHILSYCFDQKENKSKVLGKKNDQILDMIRSQFNE